LFPDWKISLCQPLTLSANNGMGKKILSNISFVPSSSGILIWFQQKPEIWNNFLSKKIWIVYLNRSLKWILSFLWMELNPFYTEQLKMRPPNKIFFVRLNYLFCSSVLFCPRKSKKIKNERIKLEKMPSGLQRYVSREGYFPLSLLTYWF
jgi:hypothetical protein